ncbi:hypothetical protein LTSEWAN_1198, partial [Salmonella enterica subsp. enterica serovar Wandsworth str. A4-580]
MARRTASGFSACTQWPAPAITCQQRVAVRFG